MPPGTSRRFDAPAMNGAGGIGKDAANCGAPKRPLMPLWCRPLYWSTCIQPTNPRNKLSNQMTGISKRIPTIRQKLLPLSPPPNRRAQKALEMGMMTMPDIMKPIPPWPLFSGSPKHPPMMRKTGGRNSATTKKVVAHQNGRRSGGTENFGGADASSPGASPGERGGILFSFMPGLVLIRFSARNVFRCLAASLVQTSTVWRIEKSDVACGQINAVETWDSGWECGLRGIPNGPSITKISKCQSATGVRKDQRKQEKAQRGQHTGRRVPRPRKPARGNRRTDSAANQGGAPSRPKQHDP